jgi:hypothetical protein
MSEHPILDRVDLTADEPMSSSVDHPSHYHSQSGIEVIDAIEAWGLGFWRLRPGASASVSVT